MDHSANRSAVPVILVIALFSGSGSVGKPDLASSGPFPAWLHPPVSTIKPTSPASPSLPSEKTARSRADDGVSRQSLVRSQESLTTGFDPFGSSETLEATDADIQQTTVTSDTGPIVHTIQFNNNDISDVFTVISTVGGWSIFPTVEVSKAKVTLWATGITARELLDQVVQLAGFVYHQEGDTISVMTYDEYAQHYGVSRKVISLKYANPASIKLVVTELLTKLGKIVVHNETNTLILYEVPANQETLISMIKHLDTPTEGVIAEVVNLKYADCQDMAGILADVFTNQKDQDKNKSQPIKPVVTGRISKGGKAQPEESTSIPFDQVSVHPVPHANQIVIVGLEGDINKVKELVGQMDITGNSMVIEVIPLEYADVQLVGNALQNIFAGDQSTNKDQRAEGKTAIGEKHSLSTEIESSTEGLILVSPNSHVEIQAIDAGNQLIVKAYRTELDKIKNLIAELDVFIEPITRNYRFVYIDAAQVYRDVERTLNMYGRRSRSSQMSRSGANTTASRGGYGGGSSRENSVTLVERTNSIVLTGPPSAHRIMTSIHEGIDAAGQYETGMIEVYKIQNGDVQEIADTLQEILQPQQEQEEEIRRETQVGESFFEQPPPESRQMEDMQEYVPQVEAKVSVNKTTNSIVVQATARQHREIDKLIDQLDVRRKQVSIKAMIVEVSSNDSTELGVELDYVNRGSDDGAATSFGLSALDFFTGERSDFLGPGGTIALLDPTSVQVVIRALQSNDNIKIESKPEILVNNHETGQLESISEEPTRQTDQGQTSTTTSFGEYVKAGTQFIITPHISEEDYIHVEYMINVSAFGEKADPELPPARSTSTLSSKPTVPDGHTIVVGGIQRSNHVDSVNKVPILGDLPILGLLFRRTTTRKQQVTTYLFITTTIMKSDNFSDLKKVSTETLQKAEEQKSNYQHQSSP